MANLLLLKVVIITFQLVCSPIFILGKLISRIHGNMGIHGGAKFLTAQVSPQMTLPIYPHLIKNCKLRK